MAKMGLTLGLLVMLSTVVSVYGLSPATVHFTNLNGQADEDNADVMFPDTTEVGLDQVDSLCFERISDIRKWFQFSANIVSPLSSPLRHGVPCQHCCMTLLVQQRHTAMWPFTMGNQAFVALIPFGLSHS